MTFLKRLYKDEAGQGLVEYGLILALISVVCLVALAAVGTRANTTLEKVRDSLPES